MFSRKFMLPFVAFIALSAPAVAQQSEPTATMTLEGLGEVRAKPDMAFVNSGVTTQAETAREALDANTAAMSELIATLKSAGVEERDIQTSNFSIQPQYVYSDLRDSNGYTPPPRISGYQVSNSVAVRVRDLENLGRVLDQAVTVGANTINGISFSVEDTSDLLDEARQRAIADVERKAQLYAEAANLTLGRILSISEVSRDTPEPLFRARTMAMDMAESAPVPVEAGEMTYEVRVSVSWLLEEN